MLQGIYTLFALYSRPIIYSFTKDNIGVQPDNCLREKAYNWQVQLGRLALVFMVKVTNGRLAYQLKSAHLPAHNWTDIVSYNIDRDVVYTTG